MGVCMCVCVWHHHSTIDSYLCVYANIAECLQLHKAVILLLIMKNFVLKVVLHSHTTTPCNFLSSPLKENHSQDTLTICINSKG